MKMLNTWKKYWEKLKTWWKIKQMWKKRKMLKMMKMMKNVGEKNTKHLKRIEF